MTGGLAVIILAAAALAPSQDIATGSFYENTDSLGLHLNLSQDRLSPSLAWLHSHELSFESLDLPWQFIVSYGPELGLVTSSTDSAEGGLAGGLVRATLLGWALGLSGEAALEGAWGRKTEAFALARFGGFLSFYYLDVGYCYQLPLGDDRVFWLPDHLLSIRIRIPLLRY